MGAARKTIEDVLDKLVIQADGCWTWPGANPYGQVRRLGKNYKVHRVVYEHVHGPIPEGYDLDHCCLNKACAHPDHTEPVTKRENTLRARRLITHCPQGHEYDEANTCITGIGGRACRQCAREQNRANMRRFREKQRA